MKTYFKPTPTIRSDDSIDLTIYPVPSGGAQIVVEGFDETMRVVLSPEDCEILTNLLILWRSP